MHAPMLECCIFRSSNTGQHEKFRLGLCLQRPRDERRIECWWFFQNVTIIDYDILSLAHESIRDQHDGVHVCVLLLTISTHTGLKLVEKCVPSKLDEDLEQLFKTLAALGKLDSSKKRGKLVVPPDVDHTGMLGMIRMQKGQHVPESSSGRSPKRSSPLTAAFLCILSNRWRVLREPGKNNNRNRRKTLKLVTKFNNNSKSRNSSIFPSPLEEK